MEKKQEKLCFRRNMLTECGGWRESLCEKNMFSKRETGIGLGISPAGTHQNSGSSVFAPAFPLYEAKPTKPISLPSPACFSCP